MKKILVVDDDKGSTDLLKEVFEAENWEVKTANHPAAAIDLAEREKFDLLVSDVNLEAEKSGIDLLRVLHSKMPVILVTGFGSLEKAVEATREGAWDFISKPFKVDEVVQAARRALDRSKSESETVVPSGTEEVSTTIVGRSPVMIELYKEIARVAPTRSTVLILGESGTGKELVARAIHENSKRKDEAFVAINCGALTETLLESELFGYVKGAFTGANGDRRGLWEEANRGTLFLDEIGEISLAMQVKLLRALQENEIRRVGSSVNTRVNARIIAATNRNLEKEIEEETFREDLFYRLSVFTIKVPPLRDRKSDIPLLAERFLQKAQTKTDKNNLELTDETLKLLSVYDWKGNVRELEASVEYAVLHSPGNIIMPDDLPPKLRSEANREAASKFHLNNLYDDLPSLAELEKRYLEHVLEATNYNRTRAAEILEIDRRTLYRMVERFDIDFEE
ncbi:MAG: sigma-54-dependent Fis family transcriptional regulator [Acidobacteria bacterium]|nr:sigma-54-dependent Fis family transcriptional regulator [Acidobacteriota bacterium]